MTNEQVWQAVLGEIEVSLSRANFITWFKDTFISSFENGKVVKLMDFGAFVEIAPGIEGLVHVSEMSYAKRTKSHFGG